MTHEKKITYMEIAARLCKFGFETKHLDTLVSLYELVMQKEGNADMLDVAKVQAACESRDQERKKKVKKKKN